MYPPRKKNKPIDEHVDTTYGKKGMRRKKAFENGYQIFRLGSKIQDARIARGLTQDQLAKKVGMSKSYICRVENNVTEIRLSTLQKIVRIGLELELKVTIDLPSDDSD
jgi:HTH-type transcriptional regulator/antitoxin HipB